MVIRLTMMSSWILISLSLVQSITARSAIPSPIPAASDTERTIWDEISCTSALVHHPLVILGDLHVHGRIQLLASANLSVYEDSPSQNTDDFGHARAQVKIETKQLSKFANERCSHTVITKKTGGIPTLQGDLYLPHSNLIIGADLLVVGGTIKSRGLSIDGAGTVLANARLLEQDPQCNHKTENPGVKINHGLLHVKNGSSLNMYGGLEAPAIGADRGGIIELICGSINARDSTGEIPGDVAILGSSALIMSMRSRASDGNRKDNALIIAQTLVIGENSILEIEGGKVDVEHFKVAAYGAASIMRGSISADLLIITTGSTMRLFESNYIEAKTAIIIGLGATLASDSYSQVSGSFDSSLSLRRLQQGGQVAINKAAAKERPLRITAGALELTDGAVVRLMTESVALKEHLSIDDWSECMIRGDVSVGEWVSVSNMSRAIFQNDLNVSTSMQIKFGAQAEVQNAQISCSLVVSGGSKLLASSLTLRRLSDITDSIYDNLEECQRMTPALLSSKYSEVEIARASVNGTIFLNNRSKFTSNSLTQSEGGVIVKKESRFYVHGGPFLRTQFIDTSGLSNSTIQSATTPVHIDGVRVEDSSSTSILAPKLYLDWVDVHSKSKLRAEVEELFVRQEIVVEEVSNVELIGSVVIEGAFLSAVRSKSSIGGRCNDRNRIDIIQLRDASQVIVQSSFNRSVRPEIELLSSSYVDLQCPVRDATVFLNKSTDSTYKAHSTWQTSAKDISMAVPPSESMSIKYLTPKTVVNGFTGGNSTSNGPVSSESQRKTKASGWKTIEKLNNNTMNTESELSILTQEDPLENSSPIRKTTAKDKRRRSKDD